MKREIKFRYRYTDGKNWIFQSFTLEQIINGEPFEILSDNPMLKNYKYDGYNQYTGLKDKNCNEIYEGDVCKFYNKYSNKWYTHVVRYCPHLACFGLYPNMEEVWNYESDWLRMIDTEVIGNIYENPELLNQ